MVFRMHFRRNAVRSVSINMLFFHATVSHVASVTVLSFMYNIDFCNLDGSYVTLPVNIQFCIWDKLHIPCTIF